MNKYLKMFLNAINKSEECCFSKHFVTYLKSDMIRYNMLPEVVIVKSEISHWILTQIKKIWCFVNLSGLLYING